MVNHNVQMVTHAVKPPMEPMAAAPLLKLFAALMGCTVALMDINVEMEVGYFSACSAKRYLITPLSKGSFKRALVKIDLIYSFFGDKCILSHTK